jgi:hypothetical protein
MLALARNLTGPGPNRDIRETMDDDTYLCELFASACLSDTSEGSVDSDKLELEGLTDSEDEFDVPDDTTDPEDKQYLPMRGYREYDSDIESDWGCDSPMRAEPFQEYVPLAAVAGSITVPPTVPEARWYDTFNYHFVTTDRARVQLPACQLVACLKEPVKHSMPLASMAEDYVRGLVGSETDVEFGDSVVKKFVDSFLTHVFHDPRVTLAFRIVEVVGTNKCVVSPRSWRAFEIGTGFSPR